MAAPGHPVFSIQPAEGREIFGAECLWTPTELNAVWQARPDYIKDLPLPLDGGPAASARFTTSCSKTPSIASGGVNQVNGGDAARR